MGQKKSFQEQIEEYETHNLTPMHSLGRELETGMTPELDGPSASAIAPTVIRPDSAHRPPPPDSDSVSEGETADAPPISSSRASGSGSASSSSSQTPWASGYVAGSPSGGFTFERVLGRGGCGEVWEAVQNSLGRKVAVKVMRRRRNRGNQETSDATAAEQLRTFQQEALITACLDHPNIVPVYDMGVDANNQPLIAMKLAKGTPWDELLKQDRNMEFQEFLRKHLPIVADVAQALAFAHQQGVVHRDVKPSQVIVGEFGEVLLADWGLAVQYRELGDQDTAALFEKHGPARLAEARNPAGTPAYMAPEQTDLTAERIGPWTDVFLLGATLYQLLVGKAPYSAPRLREAITRAREYDLVPPMEGAPDARRIPPELNRICLKAMARDPHNRYGSVRAFLDDLTDYLIGAGKRQASIELTNEAIGLLAKQEFSYEELDLILEKLHQAVALFPTNSDAPQLVERTKWLFAETALNREDLGLARFQAGQLVAGRQKEGLLRRIAMAERQRDEDRIRLRRLSATVVVLLFALIASVLWGLDRAEAARQAAASAPVAPATQQASPIPSP